MAQQGVPYRFATALPGVSFDCSGLTHYAWAQAGVYLPRNSRAQFAATPRVPVAEAKPGDLIYFYNPISHVGLYIGNGQMVHAPNTGSVVHVRNVNWGKVVGVTRPG
jgi:cell wall-associated NlpC family hydrolase